MQALLGLPAPAKINLFLHVIGRRSDGKHLLESAFSLVNVCDTIDLIALENNTIERKGDIIGDSHQDLCVRAAQLLKERFHIQTGVQITVKKRIPSGAGLGGGSSDAATTLIGLNNLWDLHLSRSALLALGLELGADVPFFLFGHTAFVEGIGEKLTHIDLPEARFAIIWPGKSVSTAKIFSSPALTRDSKSTKICDFLDIQTSSWPVLFGRNDLQAVAINEEPEIAKTLHWLKNSLQCEPRMTGSGSAVFGVLPSGEPTNLAELGPWPQDWKGFVAESLSEHPLAQWLDD